MPSISQLEKLLAIDPNDAFVLYGLAQEYAKLGDHTKALTMYDRSLVVAPDDAYTYFHKARSQQAMNQLDAARATLKAGLDAAGRTRDGKAMNELRGFLDELS
jgi:tetratricopeptide (TPR) repeat protein